MDHLPLPPNPFIGRFDVPFLCNEKYDYNIGGSSFKSFPARNGWTVEFRLNGVMAYARHGQAVMNDIAIGGLLQAWLYFGLLGEVLGKEVDQSLFKDYAADGTILFTSRCLEDLVSTRSVELLESGMLAQDGNPTSNEDYLYDCLFHTHHLFMGLAYNSERQKDNNSVLPAVCLSIAVLGEYLDQTLGNALVNRGLDCPKRLLWRIPSWGDSCWPLVNIMKTRGWCPNRLACFESEDYKSIGRLWYFANLEAPNAHEDHAVCMPQQCQMLQIDQRDYHTRHLQSDCTCAFRGARYDLLAEAIENEKVPLVRIEEEDRDDRSGSPELRVDLELATAETEYVAISHVWADGMGNLQSNSLPQCLLRQHRDYVNALSVQTSSPHMLPFWMDTLCLPREPLTLRQKGLVMFSDVFRRARHVLVLDSYLQRMDSRPMSPSEMVARVTASGWMRRLWTFSEGRLSRSIYFQFRDQAVNLFQAMDGWVRAMPSRRIPTTPSYDVDMAMIHNFCATGIGGQQLKLPDLRFALSSRSTSWAPDEAICLAGVLGMDMRKVVSATETDKMKVFWSLMQKLPTGLAFSNASRKLTAPGYRWAPASLMGDLTLDDWSGPNHLGAKLDARPSTDAGGGLIVRLPGIVFEANSRRKEAVPENLKARFFNWCLPSIRDSANFKQVVGVGHQQSQQRYLPYSYGPGDLALEGRETGVWYSCGIGNSWHQEPASIDITNEVPAIILASSVVFDRSASAPLPRRRQTYPNAVVSGLLVTYSQSQTIGQEDMIQVKAHSHVDFSIMSAKAQTFHAQIKDCCMEIFEHYPEIVKVILHNNDEEAIKETLVPWLTEYASKNRLLEIGREIQQERNEKDTDEHVILRILLVVLHLCRLSCWVTIEEISEPATWCID